MHAISFVQGIGRPALHFICFAYCPKMTRAFSVNALLTHFSNTLGSNTPWFTKKVSCRSRSSNCSFKVRLPMIVAKIPPTEWIWFYTHVRGYYVVQIHSNSSVANIPFAFLLPLLPIPSLFLFPHPFFIPIILHPEVHIFTLIKL